MEKATVLIILALITLLAGLAYTWHEVLGTEPVKKPDDKAGGPSVPKV